MFIDWNHRARAGEGSKGCDSTSTSSEETKWNKKEVQKLVSTQPQTSCKTDQELGQIIIKINKRVYEIEEKEESYNLPRETLERKGPELS